jgi:hypothetical protein
MSNKKYELRVFFEEEDATGSEATHTGRDEYLIIKGLPIAVDHWKTWTRLRILIRQLDVPLSQQAIDWLNHLKQADVIKDWTVLE